MQNLISILHIQLYFSHTDRLQAARNPFRFLNILRSNYNSISLVHFECKKETPAAGDIGAIIAAHAHLSVGSLFQTYPFYAAIYCGCVKRNRAGDFSDTLLH